MNPASAKAIGDFLLDAIEEEFPTTKRVLEALPQAQYSWQPHPKGKTAGELAWHVAGAEVWFFNSVAAGKFDQPEPPALKTMAEVLAFYEREFPKALARLRTLTPEQLATPTPFAIFNEPLVVYLQLGYAHSIHHRGQLSTYLRAMGEKVPGIYGGSADEPLEHVEGQPHKIE
jgi:uncharacterized damage-inducible protein DinB